MTGPMDLDILVRAYVPSGDEASHSAALDALESGRQGWPRNEFSPGHFTASGFVGSPDGTSLLLIHHGRLHRWLQPGGHMEAGDATVEAAARREVAEETGIADLVRLGHGLLRIDAHPIPERARRTQSHPYRPRYRLSLHDGRDRPDRRGSGCPLGSLRGSFDPRRRRGRPGFSSGTSEPPRDRRLTLRVTAAVRVSC